MRTEFLIIGSGIAGLFTAINLAEYFPEKNILIITKDNEAETNTKYAQGGIAGVFDHANDSFEAHIEDTLIAGDGLCDKKIVELVIKEGPEQILKIASWGVNFDLEQGGRFHFGKEGGHNFNRILHHKDSTGLEIETTLLRKAASCKNIQILSHHLCIDLLILYGKRGEKCAGVQVMDLTNLTEFIINAKYTILAAGGCGQVYQHTTNPEIATGDGIAMAIRAGVCIRDMAFVQFHPTALFNPNSSKTFLITEALRGEGAILKNEQGECFMKKYDLRGSLAPRDIVARSIFFEMKKHKSQFVHLDCTHLDKKIFVNHFPNIYLKCQEIGIDPGKTFIPVVPAAHYFCGGIHTNEWGETSMENLYACGEIACTGLHGANRLASNSLLEALVMGKRCAMDIAENFNSEILPITCEPQKLKLTPDHLKFLLNDLKLKIRRIMSEHAGIIRNTEGLLTGERQIISILNLLNELTEEYSNFPDLIVTKNIAYVSLEIIKDAISRKSNHGLHFNADFAPMHYQS